jgi:hypothetical protein
MGGERGGEGGREEGVEGKGPCKHGLRIRKVDHASFSSELVLYFRPPVSFYCEVH